MTNIYPVLSPFLSLIYSDKYIPVNYTYVTTALYLDQYLHQLENVTDHHTNKSPPLMIMVDSSKEVVQVFYMVPSC